MPRFIGAAALLWAACGSGQPPQAANENPPGDLEAVPPVDDEPIAPIDAPNPTASPTAVDENGVRWALQADPSVLSMAQRDRFTIRIVATNETAASVNPQQHMGQFQLDGASHFGLDLWFGNGLRSAAWQDLPAGASVRDERRPGEQLFEAAGVYVISYVHGRATAAVTVTVTD